MRKKIVALISLGLMIIVTWSFFGTHAETVAPILNVGDQWSYGWFNGEFTNATGEVGGLGVAVTVDRMEDFDGVRCYVCIYDYRGDPHENRTQTVWMTSDWVILKTEDYYIYTVPDAETRITFIWSPGMKLYDFPLTVGKEWSERSYRTIEQSWYDHAKGEEEKWTGEVDYIDWLRRVVSTETVTVPAGIFDTYVVEGVGAEPIMGLGQRVYFSPDAKTHVKWEAPGMSGGGEVLTSYELAPQANEQENGSSNMPLIIVLPAAIGVLGITFLIYNRRNQATKDT